MKALDIEVAVMQLFGVRQNTIVPNVSWGVYNLHECDLLMLSKSGYATEIEIKVSKSDLLKDKEKKHGHYHHAIKYLYFAVPKGLEEMALSEIPERSGLIVCEMTEELRFDSKLCEWTSTGSLYPTAKIIRRPKASKNPTKWSQTHIINLYRLGTMRILGLKQKIQKLKANN
jgi:hypothetical protein